MVEYLDRDIRVNKLLNLKLVEIKEKSNYSNKKYFNKYIIEVDTPIHSKDLKRYFPETSGIYPIHLTFNKFNSIGLVERFIKEWITNNSKKLKQFQDDYKWVVLD